MLANKEGLKYHNFFLLKYLVGSKIVKQIWTSSAIDVFEVFYLS